MPANIRLKVSTPPPIKLRYIEAVTKPEVEKIVTPTYEGVEVTPPSGTTLSKVTVEPIPLPTEEETYSGNGDYDVSHIGIAHVRVPQGVFPTGTKQISIRQNGTTTEDVSAYADAEITVNTNPAKGVVFGDYDEDGYPHSAEFVGTWTTIPKEMFYSFFVKNYATITKKIESILIPDQVGEIYQNGFASNNSLTEIVLPNNDLKIYERGFYECASVVEWNFKRNVTLTGTAHFTQYGSSNITKRVIFSGNVNAIPNQCFLGKTGIELYDFSHCTAIPSLFSVASLGHAAGCVIRIPAALSDTTLGVGNGWESATNWSALTNIVWEVV